MDKSKEFLNLFPTELRCLFYKTAELMEEVREIRLRVNQPVLLLIKKEEIFIEKDGNWGRSQEKAYLLGRKEMESILNHICKYSVYAFESELSRGYLTVEGGHRIGIAGKIILEGEKIRNIKYISYLNIRIAHQVIGASDAFLKQIYQKGQLLNTLLISPPGGGKTTLLRDIIRQVSNGNRYAKGMTVGVIDERSEIAGCFMGVAQNDIGMRTDVLDGCPKVEGMMMLIRSMAPGMIAVDELGGKADIEALEQVLKCGCKIIATIHGTSLEDIRKKQEMSEILDKQIFGRYFVLGGKDEVGAIQKIYDEDFKQCLN